MKSRKNTGTIILMICSIALLLLLQLLWLRSSYNEELESFRKETNTLFRATILGLHDSVIMKGIIPLEPGVVIPGRQLPTEADWKSAAQGRFFNDTIEYKRPYGQARLRMLGTNMVSDSVLAGLSPDKISSIHVRDSSIQIVIASAGPGDSVQQVLRPIVSQFRRKRETGNFLFRFGSDSLRMEDIQHKYSDTLKTIGITLPPLVEKADMEKIEVVNANVFLTEPFFLPHTPPYRAKFENIRPMLLARISPQIAFSLILTALIVTAFVLMYRSIVSQQKLMQLKNDLISNITHELKTPVATVSVALEALQNFKALDNPALTQEYLTIAQNELGRLSLITDKILKTSVFEQTGVELKHEQVDLEKIIQDVLTSLKLVFEKHQAEVSFHKQGEDFTLQGNAEHLTHVVYNLLDNAIKYSKPGCAISVSLVHNKESIQLIVEDNGIGIPDEYRQKVFEKFFRVPTGDVHDAKGYGLGLNYVASVVKAHNGTIELKSEPGKGSAFTITLLTVRQ
ncbi:MAG: GHKL domain-containing protein [Cyclobacteriaceae bacterium]|nr:GHKL domain-containing protein [Cyclobacteriaceae bacterium]